MSFLVSSFLFTKSKTPQKTENTARGARLIIRLRLSCVSGWASRTRWTSTSCIDASLVATALLALHYACAALPDHPSRLLSALVSASAVAPPLPPLRADGVAAPAVPGAAAAALGAAA